jgi:pimeloyl-ACP methyl ester carboxylesterase
MCAAFAPDGTEISFTTHGSRSNPAIFMGPHFFMTRSADDPSHTDLWIDRLSSEFFLITADYPRGIGRTGNPQGLSHTPAVAAKECEYIADTAGIDCFGWLGYSFGGALGIQVACRTSRVAALVVGGFPPLNAPYQLLLDVSTSLAQDPPPLPEFRHPGILLATVGFYAPLVSWPERQEVSKLTMPRLAFMGDQDCSQGSLQPIPLADCLRAAADELLQLGWCVSWLKGHDHQSAVHPDVASATVCDFFRKALPHTARGPLVW